MNKKYIAYVAAPAVAIAAATIIGAAGVSAQTPAPANPMQNIVNAIAQKFNLRAQDVQKVFEDQRVTMETQMQQKHIDRLNQAVTDGKLTQAQVNLIIAENASIKSQLEQIKANASGKTEAEMRAAAKAVMDSVKQWATQNNIPLQYLKPGPGFGGRGMRMHPGMGLQNPAPAQ